MDLSKVTSTLDNTAQIDSTIKTEGHINSQLNTGDKISSEIQNFRTVEIRYLGGETDNIIVTIDNEKRTINASLKDIQFDSAEMFPEIGSDKLIYIDKSTDGIYVWKDGKYVMVGKDYSVQISEIDKQIEEIAESVDQVRKSQASDSLAIVELQSNMLTVNADISGLKTKVEDNTELLDQVNKGHTADAIAIVGLQGDMLTVKTDINTLKTDVATNTELLNQVNKAQSADSIAIVGLQSDVITLKADVAKIDLTEFYKKSETYNKDEVNALVNSITSFNAQIVTQLPTTGISTTTIYLIAKKDVQSNDYYDEYLYINNKWELIGTTKVDLTDYYKKTEIDAKVSTLDTKINALDMANESINEELSSQSTKINNAGVKISDLEADVQGLKEDIAESSGTKVKVGGVAVAEFDADTKVDKTTKINGRPLTQNVVLTAEDVGAFSDIPDYVVIDTIDDNSSFKAGSATSATNGGIAIGNGATSNYGASVGIGSSSVRGGAVGQSTITQAGGAMGYTSASANGGAIGNSAVAGDGGAVGQYAKAGKGFSGGDTAQVALDSGVLIDAIQLGTGTNTTPKSLQIYDDNIYNANTHTLDAQVVKQNGQALALESQLASLATQVATDYYNKTDADGKFATKTSVETKAETGKIEFTNLKTFISTGVYTVDLSTCSGLPDMDEEELGNALAMLVVAPAGRILITSNGAEATNHFYYMAYNTGDELFNDWTKIDADTSMFVRNDAERIVIGSGTSIADDIDRGVAIGFDTDNTLENGVSVGVNIKNNSWKGVAIGSNLQTSGNNSIVIGNHITNTDKANIAIGGSVNVSGEGHVAIGLNSKVSGELCGVAVGNGSVVGANYAIQLGVGTNNTANTLQIGGDNIYNHETHTLSVQEGHFTKIYLE